MRKLSYILLSITGLIALFLQGCTGISDWFGGGQTTNRAPDKPSLINPSDNQTLNTMYVEFEWTCSDPDKDTLTYDLYLSEQGQPLDVIEENYSLTKYSTVLEPGKSYQWKVVAKDLKGATSSSKIYTFSISQSPTSPNLYDFLYISGGTSKLVIYDINQPNALRYPIRYEEDINSTKELAFLDGWAYVVDSSGDIICVNLKDYLSGKQTQPNIISLAINAKRVDAGSFNGSNYLIVAGDERVLVYNIATESTQPYDMSSVGAIAINQDTIYLAGVKDEKLKLVKMSIESQGFLNHQGEVEINYTPVDMILKDDYILIIGRDSDQLYLEAYRNDLTPYATSVALGEIAENFAGITAYDDKVFVAAGNSGILCFNVDDLAGNLEETEIIFPISWNTSAYAHDVVIRELSGALYAYVSASDGLYVFDVDDIPQKISKVDFVSPLYRISAQ